MHQDIPQFTPQELIKEIQLAQKVTRLMLVQAGNANVLIEAALEAVKEMKRFQVYYQPNIHFPTRYLEDKYTKPQEVEELFNDFCNYFDKHKVNSLMQTIKYLYNYSKKQEYTKTVDYPLKGKMVLVVENFNLYDFNSQNYLSKLAEENENMIIIGQLNFNFPFAIKHIDKGLVAQYLALK